MNLKKVIAWLVVAFVVFYVIQAPQSSAQFVQNVGEALGNAASSLRDLRRILDLSDGMTGPPADGCPPAPARTSRSTCCPTRRPSSSPAATGRC